jgi:hypothetical protein
MMNVGQSVELELAEETEVLGESTQRARNWSLMSKMNPVHIIVYFFKIHFKNIFPPISTSSGLLPSGFATKHRRKIVTVTLRIYVTTLSKKHSCK